MQRAIVAVAGSEPTKSESRYSNVDDANREEVGAALRMSGNTAQYRIDVARTLTAHLPGTCNALATGEISAAHATAIARESANIIASGASVEMIQKLESSAIAHAEFHTPAQVINQLRSAIAKLAPEEFAEAARSAQGSRRVSYFPERDGMATIVAFLPAADAQTVLLAIDKLARISSGEVRDSNRDASKMARFTKLASDFSQIRPLNSLDAFRADALTQFASTYLATSGETNLKHRRPITLNLTLDLPTLLGF
jgi:negative regulator of replication initiation